MTLEDSIQAMRLRVLARAEALGNVRRACRESQVSPTVFYRWRARFERYGPAGLHPRGIPRRRGRPRVMGVEVERELVAVALAWPTRGPQWFSDQLALRGLLVPPSTAYRQLQRLRLGTRRARLLVLEQQRAQTTGLVTERTRRAVRRHLQAEAPGDLVSMDTFYIGHLKGVGKVWQVTACDAASSYGLAQVTVGNRCEAAAVFLRDVVRPRFVAAGWPVRRVLTDNGREFHGVFAQTCRALGIEQRRIRPGHAWTNGVVERFQGTLLHEHWRIAFREHFFRSVAQLQRSLDRFVVFYNERRRHQGYRLRGQPPATLFHGPLGMSVSEHARVTRHARARAANA